MKKLTALFVASTLALGAANLAHAADATSATATDAAQPNAKMMHHHKGKMGQRHDMMFQGLNLTDAQKQQVRDIMKEGREHMKRPSQDEMREMHNLVASDSFDKAKAEAQINKMEQQHKAMMLTRLENQNKIYNILTPEQKKQFNANFEKRLAEHKAPEGKMTPAPAE